MNKQFKNTKILIFTDYFIPGFKAGGPIRSIENFCLLAKNHFEIYILTRNNDIGEDKAYTNLIFDEWIYNDDLNAHVYYLSKKSRTLISIKKIINQHNFAYLYLNSLYSLLFSFSVLWLAKIGKIKNKIILAPRGELNPGARKIKKLKKQIYIKFLKLFGFTKDITWHATSSMEKNYIKQVFNTENTVKLIANFPKQKQKQWEKISKEPRKVKYVAISRISKIKNIEFIINLFTDINDTAEVILNIIGPIEDIKYYDYCLSLTKKLNANIKVNFIGQIEHFKIEDLLSNHHFFISPTKGENFGHSIFEAMVAGKPVIISNMTPWTNLEIQKAGWDIALNNMEKWKEIIKKTIDMNQNDYDKLSRTTWDYAKKYLSKYEGNKELKFLFS